MSCERYNRALALLVEGDLHRLEIASVNRHLAGCTRCRTFLSELEASQRGVKELAAQPLDEAALAAVRARVFATVRETERASAGPTFAWRWVVASSLVCAVAAVLVFRPRPEPPSSRLARATPVASPASPSGGGPPAASLAGSAPAERATKAAPAPALVQQSTLRPVRTVSPHVEHPPAISPLTPEEADQLARAVVAVARVRRLSDLRLAHAAELAEPPEPRGKAQVVLATTDPEVVIYWQLDSNGG
jgi:anti-sigma factor RsiW